MIVIKNNESLIVKLGATPPGSPPEECQWYVAYRETTDVTYEFNNNSEFSNGTNNVTMLDVTALEPVLTRRIVDDISVYNPSASAEVYVIFDNGTDEIILFTTTLSLNETLNYSDKEGWNVKGVNNIRVHKTSLANASLTDIYTVPANKRAEVFILVANLSLANKSFRIAISPLGAAISNHHYTHYDKTLSGNDSHEDGLIYKLQATDVVRVYGSDANLAFTVNGIEY
jgi:hypothetical protein